MAAQAPTTSLLMSLPLEVRHTIFEYAAARDVKPKKLLRYWFEKQEVKELVAKTVADDPNGPAPRVVRDEEYEEDSDVPEPEEEQQQDSDEDEIEDGDAEEDEDEDEVEDEDEADDGDEDVEDVQDTPNTNSQSSADVAAPAQAQAQAAMDGAAPAIAAPSTAASATTANPSTVTFGQDVQDEDGDTPMTGAGNGEHSEDIQDTVNDAVEGTADENTEDIQDPMNRTASAAQAQDNDNEDEDTEDIQDTANDTAAAAAQAPPQQAPIIRASRKWRHIPNFMRLTHCPPPSSLLLTSKQLNAEAKNWFYDVAILRISATNAFSHTSFFEEAFSQITDAAFSPMENIRKVEVMFVWDTTWLRADETGFAAAVFPALLRQRADFVHKILMQAPDLNEVVVQWHDSAQDDESMGFMLDVTAPFHGLNAEVKVVEKYIEEDAKPHKRSIAGKQRVQFQQIVDAGIERLL